MSTMSDPPIDAFALLSLPRSETPPDPYMTLGLTSGEADGATIKAALQGVVARLNAVKPHADPQHWKQAATWVKQAQRTLADPQLKAVLDQRFASPVAVTLPHRPRFFAGPVSPIAVLGSRRAAAAVSDRASPATAPPLVPVTPPVAAPPSLQDSDTAVTVGAWTQPAAWKTAEPTAATDAAVPEPLPLPSIRKLRRRKRQSPWTAAAYLLVVVACIGGLTGLMVFLSRNPVVLTHSPSADQNPATTSPSTAAEPDTWPEMPQAATADDEDWTQSVGGRGDSMNESPRAGNPMSSDPQADETMSDDGMSDDGMGAAFADDFSGDAGMDDTAADMAGAAFDADDAALTAGEAAIEVARQAIAAAQWGQMTAAAEAAVQAASGEQQLRDAGDLLLLAQLASSYNAAIEQTLTTADRGKVLQITDQLQVAIVAVTADNVSVKFNGRDRQFPRQSLPLVIAHGLAKLSLPGDQPRDRVAAEAYQAVAPVTTTQYRYLAMNHLDDFDVEDPQCDPRSVVRAILQVYPK